MRITTTGTAGIYLIKGFEGFESKPYPDPCLLYTSDAADERSSVDLGGRRIIKKKNREKTCIAQDLTYHIQRQNDKDNKRHKEKTKEGRDTNET